MPEVDLRDLSFPVLCLSQDNSIVPVESAQSLTECSATAFFRNRYFDHLLVIDSNASSFVVISADPVVPIASLRRTLARLLNQRIRVRLRLERAGSSSLASAQAAVSGWLERAPEFWEAAYDLAEWKQRVATVATMRELIALFA